MDDCEDLKLLTSHYFPCKVGGKPVSTFIFVDLRKAWLNWENLPKRDNLACKVCGKQLAFLLQVVSHCGLMEGLCKC